MVTLNRNRRELHLCSRYIDENGNELFKEPVKIYIPTQNKNSHYEVAALGEQSTDKLRLLCEKDYFDIIHEGDRFYVYVIPPEEHDIFGNHCDYKVNSILYNLNTMDMTMEKLIK